MAAKNQEMSQDTKTIITVLLLAFAYPVGLIMMFVWTKWPGWVKTLIVLPFVLGILFFFLIGGAIFSAVMKGKEEMKDVNYHYSNDDSDISTSSGEYMMEE